MNSIQFAEAVKTAFLARFPLGYFKASRLALGGGFSISAGLIANIEDQFAKIRDNDPLSVLMFLHDTAYNSDKEIDSKITVEFGRSSLMVKPTDKLYAMESHRIPARKMNNTPEKVVQSLENISIRYWKRSRNKRRRITYTGKIASLKSISISNRGSNK